MASSKEKYWNRMSAIEKKTHSLPKNAFDFISIHYWEDRKEYRLLSPLCLIDTVNSERPGFELDKFPSKKIAEKAAKMLVALAEKENNLKIQIVDCH